MTAQRINNRNGSIDFWKFVCAAAILIFHSHLFALDEHGIPFVGGALAVDFFFIVSGYLMAKSTAKIDLTKISAAEASRNFILHKVARLCPEVPIAWIIAFVIKNFDSTADKVTDHLAISVWDFFFLRMSGIPTYPANQAAWYISAMLIGMAILVPFLLKYREMFIKVAAPIIAILLLGYLHTHGGGLRQPTEWLGVCYRGTVRAIAELCIGCILYDLSQRISAIEFTKTGSILTQLIEWICYGTALGYLYVHAKTEMGFVIMLLFAVGIFFSFVGKGAFAGIFNNKLVYFLGNFSLCIYLAQHSWALRMNDFFPGMRYRWQLLIYLALALATAVVIYLLSECIRRQWPKMKAWMQRKCIASAA